MTSDGGAPPGRARALLEVLAVATRLGLTSFGGPVAHLGYFRQEYVVRRRWLDEARYADLVALCQVLPGPASSQVGMAVGLWRAGLPGAIAAWLGFTLPSAILLVAFAGVARATSLADAGWLHGLKIVAVAVVAQAVWGLGRALAPDRARASLAFLAAVTMLASRTAATQVLVIAAAGLVGRALLEGGEPPDPPGAGTPAVGRGRPRPGVAVAALLLFAALLVALPIARRVAPVHALAVLDGGFRAGALVFGGGHVVLPLLEAEFVRPGWVSRDEFIAGYGAAQAVPGPLFTFAAYLGAVSHQPPNGWVGGAWALVAVFLPSFLLVVGTLPFWESLRRRPGVRAALRGINAAVVGLLLAALYDPVWQSAIRGPTDLALALVAFALLAFWAVPPWLVVALSAAATALF